MAEGDAFEYSSNLMVWIWRILIVTIIAIYIFVFTAGYLSKDVDTTDLELNSFKNRLLFSPSCLAYEDGTPHPGIVDILKFDEIRVNKCFQKNNFKFQLGLYDLANNKIKSIASSPTDLQVLSLCNSIKTLKCSILKEYILIKNQTRETPGILEVYILKNV